MTLRPYTAIDHDLLAQWWTAHGWPTLPQHAIPPFSFFVQDDHHERAFACAYLDNGGTGLALLEWIVTHPDNSPRESLKALNTLLPFMRDHLVTELGYTMILATCRQPSLSRLLNKHGFQTTDKEVTHHVYAHQ